MRTVQEIKEAIRLLSTDDRAALSAWLAEAEAADWDRELESDVESGRLGWLLKEAREDLRSGRCTER